MNAHNPLEVIATPDHGTDQSEDRRDDLDKVLIVEDSKFFRKLLQHAVEHRTGLAPVVASSLAEARQLLEGNEDKYLLSLLDLNLPDSSRCEIVDYVSAKNIPAIVFTGEFDEALREDVLAKNVIDYVVKANRSSLDQVVSQISRFRKNRDVTVLVVAGSQTENEYVTGLLALHGFNVLSAYDGEDALEQVAANPGIALVITDYRLPKLDGLKLISRLRDTYSKNELAIIGLSGDGDSILSARFLKIGANDYLHKPFQPEEFYCRVNQNIEILETIRNLKHSATRDFLTGLYNRRLLMESGARMLAASKRQGEAICVALLDIDFFKSINDTYGHDAGDMMLKSVARTISKRFRSADIVARYGGEEFCVVMNVEKISVAQGIFNELRDEIREASVNFDGDTLSVTVSIGITIGLADNLEDLLSEADTNLYAAKESGRDRAVTTLFGS